VLAVLGVPVYLSGNLLHLPNITLEVARVCSGVNYLIAVLAVGVPLAYLSFTDWTRRAVLITLGIATAALFNSVRVALIGWMAYYELSEIRHGPWHVLQGLSVSLVGFVALFACWAVLLRIRPRRNREGVAAGRRPSVSRLTSASAVGCLVAAVLLALGGGLRGAELGPVPVDLSSRVPLHLGDWSASAEKKGPVAPFPRRTWPDEIWREYRSNDGRTVLLYVGRYLWRRAAGMPRPYWTDGSNMESSPVSVGGAVNVAAATLPGPPRTRLLLWYQLGERVTTSRFTAKIVGLRDVVARRSPGPLVVVVAAPPGVPEATGTLQEFAQALMTALRSMSGTDAAAITGDGPRFAEAAP
jgi:EpsI family protein